MTSVTLFSSDKDVIQREISMPIDEVLVDEEDIAEMFEISRCVSWIKSNNLKHVTLQFPDPLLQFSAKVAKMMEDLVQQRIAILGDTSYGDCCVDEVAADHIGADGVIHFGNTCLTATQRLKVLYIYTQLPIDVENLLLKLKKHKEQNSEKGLHLFYDVRYHRAILRHEDIFRASDIKLCKPSGEELREPNRVLVCGRILETDIQENDDIIFCGNCEKLHNILALTYSKNQHFQFYNDELIPRIARTSKELMKRYYLIEKTKDAKRIGILVGTLGVSRFRDIIEKISESIKNSGKKAYIFLVGKPNVPKLANFPEIDVFVMIACPQNSIVSSKEFMQPVITPFELDVALNSNRVWDGRFFPDFHDILPNSDHFLDFKPSTKESDISLISGQVRGGLKINDSYPEDASNVLSSQVTTVSTLHEDGGGEYLRNRSWRGLEQNLGKTQVEMASKGQKGIAMNYEGEGKREGNQ